jgi:hypothetical protein
MLGGAGFAHVCPVCGLCLSIPGSSQQCKCICTRVCAHSGGVGAAGCSAGTAAAPLLHSKPGVAQTSNACCRMPLLLLLPLSICKRTSLWCRPSRAVGRGRSGAPAAALAAPASQQSAAPASRHHRRREHLHAWHPLCWVQQQTSPWQQPQRLQPRQWRRLLGRRGAGPPPPLQLQPPRWRPAPALLPRMPGRIKRACLRRRQQQRAACRWVHAPIVLRQTRRPCVLPVRSFCACCNPLSPR